VPAAELDQLAVSATAEGGEASTAEGGEDREGGRRRRRRGGRGRGADRGEAGAEGGSDGIVAVEGAAASAETAVEAIVEAPAATVEATVTAVEPVAAEVVVAEQPVVAEVAPVVAPAVQPPAPFVLATDELAGVAQAAGLQWVATDEAKAAAVRAAIAAEPKPVHVPREIKPMVAVDDGPLVLVETRKNLAQIKLPFEQQH
jgi:ribonuclease E